MYGTALIDLAYKNSLGFFLTDHILSNGWMNRIMGAFEDSSLSKSKIPSFIQNYEINMNEYENVSYRSFNDFFTRRFKPEARVFARGERQFCAGAEGRYLAFENISAHSRVTVKGIELQLQELLGNFDLAEEFDGGTFIVCRLCPVDYHRYHFPLQCTLHSSYTLHGEYHSVNPVALEKDPTIFLKNERQVAILENSLFGKIAMIEVGALGVGKIVQSAYGHPNGHKSDALQLKFEKGQEKGYFLFGGSTVIWLVQKGKLTLSEDLAQNSKSGIETWIPLGDSLGEYHSEVQHQQ